MRGWILDKSAAVRTLETGVQEQLDALTGMLCFCPMAELEHLYSARSARDYDDLQAKLRVGFESMVAPADVLLRALALQHDLAHHHGMWHRTPISDLVIAETALYHGLGVVHIDGHFDRIAEVRPLVARRLRYDGRHS